MPQHLSAWHSAYRDQRGEYCRRQRKNIEVHNKAQAELVARLSELANFNTSIPR